MKTSSSSGFPIAIFDYPIVRYYCFIIYYIFISRECPIYIPLIFHESPIFVIFFGDGATILPISFNHPRGSTVVYSYGSYIMPICSVYRIFNNNWLVVWNIFYFPIYWECHHPNWLYHIFQRGSVQTTNQTNICPKNHPNVGIHIPAPWFAYGIHLSWKTIHFFGDPHGLPGAPAGGLRTFGSGLPGGHTQDPGALWRYWWSLP